MHTGSKWHWKIIPLHFSSSSSSYSSSLIFEIWFHFVFVPIYVELATFFLSSVLCACVCWFRCILYLQQCLHVSLVSIVQISIFLHVFNCDSKYTQFLFVIRLTNIERKKLKLHWDCGFSLWLLIFLVSSPKKTPTELL